MQTHPTAAALRCRILIAAALAACSFAQAQTAPALPPTDTATLAKYDKNKNGKLDPDELEAMDAERKGDAVLLNPFEVRTDKDAGYAAGNTLAGGRINTELALTPSAISVITKQFMEDFAITDFNDAAQWTMNVDLPSGFGGDAPFGGNRFEFNVRGAQGAGNYPIRDGIPQYFVSDSYNTDRFEITSGPNSGMAGLGNSGGMIGSSSKRVRFRNSSGSASARIDNFGGYRGTLDYNYGRERIGVRLNLLHQDTKTIQESTSNKQNAFTLRVEYKLTSQTLFSAQWERSAEWNTQYRRTYGDQQSFWNRTTVNTDNSALATAGTGLSQISATNDRLTYNFNTGTLINYRGNQYQTTGLGYQIPWEGNPNVPTQWPGGANFMTSVGKTYWLGPIDNFADRDNNARNFTLSHNFSPDLTARLTYQYGSVDPVTYWGDFSQPGDFRVDVNRLLPNGAVNPNYLRSYSEWGAGGSQYQENTSNDYAAEVSYRFRVPRFFDLKQSFNGIYTYRKGHYSAWSRTWRRNNNPANLDPLNGVNALTFRAYHGDPQVRVQPIITQEALNALMPGTTWGWYGSTGWHADSDRNGRNHAIYSTTSFLNDRVVISGNYRQDRIINADLNGINVGGRANDPNNNYARYIGNTNPATKLAEVGYVAKLDAAVNSYGYGTVVTPFPDRWTWLAPIKLVYNYSENYREPTSGGPLYTGELPTPPFSKTTDFAVRYSIPGGKVYGEIRRYFTKNLGNLSGMANTGDIQNIWRNLGYTEASKYDFSSNAYRDTSDRDLTGTEFEIVANPTNNWTLRANYGHPRVQTVNERAQLKKYYADNQAEWKAGALLPDGATVPNGGGRTIISQSAIVTAIQNIENGLNGLQPGTIGNGPLHRATFATSYRFSRESRFRGLGVSAGASWRGSSKAGSRDARLKFQTPNPTVAQTAAAAYDYLWVPSQLTNNVGFNYQRRFGKYNARFQLNITNILNDDTPLWGYNNSNAFTVLNAGQLTNQNDANALTVAGSNPRMQIMTGFQNPEPRKFVLTTTLDF